MRVRSPYLKFMSTLLLLVFSTLTLAASYADYAKDWQYHEAKISPDGKHLGLILVHDGKRRLAVVDAKTFEPVGGANFGERQQVGSFYWATNKRLIIKVAHHLPWQEQPIDAGELFAVDYDGKRGKLIYGFRAGGAQTGSNIKGAEATNGHADIVHFLPQDQDNILISSLPYSRDGSRVPTVHKLNINSGRMSGVKYSGPAAQAQFIADRIGNVKVAVGTDKNADTRVFVLSADEEWEELDTDKFGSAFYPMLMDASGENLFVADNYRQDKIGVFKLNLKTGKYESIYTNEKVDISEAVFNSDRTGVYAALIESDYPQYVVFNAETPEGELFNQLLDTFKGYRIRITSSDTENNLWLIHATNDTTAGLYYLFNKKTNQFTPLFNNFPHVAANQLSQSIPISFKATDGMDIHGYITYPASVPETQNVPLVTLVHGGPHGPRDYWDFDREVQMLTAQGYAVLRVNFRGSGGYGAKYETSGYKQWGGRIQQDIIDGTKWVIEQGGIDQDKVCIMGASFGGYSAAQASILAPDLFKCAVANAGFYDMPNLYEDGDIPDFIGGEAITELHIGRDMEQLRRFSPMFNLDKLQTPILIAHGEKDKRTPFAQAEELKERLEKLKKPHEWFVIDNETHGFYGEANRTAYYEKVTGFLAKYLK